MDPRTVRLHLSTTTVARLATVDKMGTPHLVPIVFAADQHTVYTPIDHKPKRTTELKRLANIADNPRVSVLLDHYEEDWSALWWIRLDGTASVIDDGPEWHSAIALLAAKYEHYKSHPLTDMIIKIHIKNTTTWAAADIED